MEKSRITESASLHDSLESMSVEELLININQEDHKVADAVKEVIPSIIGLVQKISENMEKGGRLFYIGAGTSGRLGIVDASECPPTFGVDHGLVVGLIAGGDNAIRKAVEFAEDDPHQAWLDILPYDPGIHDSVIGIAASGKTPYVVGGVRDARQHGLLTGCITCNFDTPLSSEVHHPIEVNVGPEFVTGSTRMKSGTAQKMILNMISTAVMIRLGRVKGNKMVDMQLSNNKLISRGVRMLVEELNVSLEEAKLLLEKYGSVRKAIEEHHSGA